jgi:hypothetical protein
MKLLYNYQNITSELGGQVEFWINIDCIVSTRKSGKKENFYLKKKSFEFETYSIYYYPKRQQNYSHIYNNHHSVLLQQRNQTILDRHCRLFP